MSKIDCQGSSHLPETPSNTARRNLSDIDWMPEWFPRLRRVDRSDPKSHSRVLLDRSLETRWHTSMTKKIIEMTMYNRSIQSWAKLTSLVESSRMAMVISIISFLFFLSVIWLVEKISTNQWREAQWSLSVVSMIHWSKDEPWKETKVSSSELEVLFLFSRLWMPHQREGSIRIDHWHSSSSVAEYAWSSAHHRGHSRQASQISVCVKFFPQTARIIPIKQIWSMMIPPSFSESDW